MSELSTIYIISKGRPQCRTAKTLTKMKYPGEWFIVCGNNDETLEQYLANWGEEHVKVFDWYDEVKRTDTMDNFGFDSMPSGACPVRNATAEISRRRGERRHWQFDDDYTGFYGLDAKKHKNVRLDADEFMRRLEAIAGFADRCGLRNAGFPPSTIEVAPDGALQIAHRVFNAHNLPSGGRDFVKWVARMNDDLINAINVWRTGGMEMSFKFMAMTMPPTQSESGGLTDIYRDEGTVRKTAYAVMAAPGQVKLVDRFGRYHHSADWKRIVPKIVSDEYCK